jgi:hypothetical protein
MVAWIHALHVQIGISTENHRLYEAEILITEDVSGVFVDVCGARESC